MVTEREGGWDWVRLIQQKNLNTDNQNDRVLLLLNL